MAELRVKETGTIKLFESDNTSSVTIASPASLGADRTITLPDASVTLASGTMNDATNLSGNIPVSNLNSGTSASSSTFWRGDGTWVAAGGGITGWDSDSGTNDSLLPDSASAGIYLGVSSVTAANLLDDYEQGTFTPVLADSSGANGWTGTGIGRYVKVGNMVFCQIVKYLTGSNANTSNAYISGLPFICDQVSYHPLNQGQGQFLASGFGYAFLYLADDDSKLSLRSGKYDTGGALGSDTTDLDEITSDGAVAANFCYYSDA